MTWTIARPTADDLDEMGRVHVQVWQEAYAGLLPDGDTVGGAMTDVVNQGTSHLNDEDLKAIAVYLKSVKPIRNKVEKKK